MKTPSADQAAGPPQAANDDEPLIHTRSQRRILENHQRFNEYASTAERMLRKGRLHEAAMHVVLAARVTVHSHAGIFGSRRLESVLQEIASRSCSEGQALPRLKQAGDIKRVLHVATELVGFGGSTRMMSRWIDADPSRQNSIVLTSHDGPLPAHSIEAVERSGGTITLLGGMIGNQFDRARKLRELARDYDLVVMHINCEDEIPILAFAHQAALPPVLFLNHADHIFWLGPGVSHAVLNLREAAADICMKRRGIAPERTLMLPTLVDPVRRQFDRAEVRKELGVSDDQVLLVSVARSAKYKNFGGQTYADRHVEILKQHPNAVLMVVGCGLREDWKPACDAVDGRIIPFEPRNDVNRFLEAADIYVDSYPFVSSTSQMEAARYGLPIVSVCEAPEAARIVGINHLGLEGTSLVCPDWPTYNSTLARLCADAEFRKATGEASRQNVAEHCEPGAWSGWLENAYQAALELPLLADRPEMPETTDIPGIGEPDVRHQEMFGSVQSLVEIEKLYMATLPFGPRLHVWRSLLKRGEFTSPSEWLIRMLPSWLKVRLRPKGMAEWVLPDRGVIRRIRWRGARR